MVSPPRDNGIFLLGVIFVPPTMGNSGIQEIIKKRQSKYPNIGRNDQKFDASVDGNLADDRDSTAI